MNRLAERRTPGSPRTARRSKAAWTPWVLLFAFPLGLLAEPVPTREDPSSGETRSVSAFATGGDGTVGSPWIGWETAFSHIPATGARVVFPAGMYSKTVAIDLPVDLTGWLVIVGDQGSVVTLTSRSPRMFDIGRTADYQVFRYVRLEGLTLDAGNLPGNHHVLVGNSRAGVVSTRQRLGYAHIEIRDVRMIHVSDTGPRTGIQLNTQHAAGGEPATSATDILIENVRQEGGTNGIVLTAAADNGDKNVRHTFENVTIRGCYHSRHSVPRAGGAGANIQLGAYGRVRNSTITRCSGRNSVDVGIEVDNPEHVVISDSTVTDAWYAGFLVTNYSSSVDPGENVVTFERCTARVLSASTSSVALRGFATYTRSSSVPPLRLVWIRSSRFLNNDATAHRALDVQEHLQNVRVEGFEVVEAVPGRARSRERRNRESP